MEFVLQGGLTAILGPNPQPSQVHDLTLRAQCFYLSRKKSVPIDFDGYKAYLSAKQDENLSKVTSEFPSLSTTSTHAFSSGDDQPPPPPPHSLPSHHEADLPSDQKSAPYPHTFAEIVALITSGAPIPGIVDIPPTVLADQATKPATAKRRKPWETELPDETEGTFGDQRDQIIIQEYPEES